MTRAKRHAHGCVRFDKRRGTWNFLFYENGTRRSRLIGTRQQYPTKSAAWKAVEIAKQEKPAVIAPIVSELAARYAEEKMPKRSDTNRTYTSWLTYRILPRWGMSALTDVQARPVELWLQSLELAPKSKVHIRGLLRSIWDYAMWAGDIPTQRNPMELVSIKGATKRLKKPRSLTADEFQKFLAELSEPFRTLALLSVCFGLRISEALALRWSDINWLKGTLSIERAIVSQRVEDTKTAESHRTMTADAAMLEVLKRWKQTSQFTAPEDWIFASPVQIGRLPWSYRQVSRSYSRAGKRAGIGHISTHMMRHTYRSWLDAAGASITAQRQMMRHTSITTTLDVYGTIVTDEMVKAGSDVTRMALNGAQTERIAS